VVGVSLTEEPTSTPLPHAEEVSCRSVRVFLDAAAARGIDPELLIEGVPFPLEHLRNRRA